MTALHVATILGDGALGLLVLVMLRRRRLQYRYALVWLGLVALTLPLAVAPSLLDRTADLFGVADPPNLLFFVAFVVVASLVILLTAELTETQRRVRILAGENALLLARVEAIEAAVEGRP